MIDLQYFGNINYFNILLKNKNIELCPNNLYQKGWFGNKTVIIGANGTISLSIPLLGGRNQKTLYKDVKIAYDQSWRLQHQKAIFSCYGNAPFFDYYKFEVENIFKQEYKYLFDLNIFIMEKMLKLLKSNGDITISQDEIKPQDVLCSKQYFQLHPHPCSIKYPQVFEDRNGFIENLSILDILFCTGTQAKDLLKI